ncbi:MAG: dipeptide ABC transporter ATP-binding protein [Stappiaceae bacterium]
MKKPLLSIRDFHLDIGSAPIIKGISLDLHPGEIFGLVGESGSGKSLTAFSAMKLLPHAASPRGEIVFDGQNVLDLDDKQMCGLRGRQMGMVFQEPMTALNPVKTIGNQVSEGIRWHLGIDAQNADKRMRKLLGMVGLPAERFSPGRYPHELSGGQRQRVVIAMAIALKPRLLIADEPTTALDVTIQAQILTLLKDIVKKQKMALLLISHDLAVVADMADRIGIMRDGAIVETGSTARLFETMKHPYSLNLREASTHVPVRKTKPVLSAQSKVPPLLSVQNLVCEYKLQRKKLFAARPVVKAVNSVSFNIYPGQSLGLVGESGCGKSTLARALLALEPPSDGHVDFMGQPLTHARPDDLIKIRRDLQVVFQDPFGSFNPRRRARWLVGEPLGLLGKEISKAEKQDRIVDVLDAVGLSHNDLDKFPHEFSGGQRQRLAIARALVTGPKLVVADEAVSALDVSIRAQILDLLVALREKLGISYLFISHDLSVVRAITDEVMVMNAGKIVEQGPTGDVFDHPKHPYTRLLVSAAPNLQQALKRRRKKERQT